MLMKPIRKDTVTVLIATIIVFVGIDLAESIKAADKSRKHGAAHTRNAAAAKQKEEKYVQANTQENAQQPQQELKAQLQAQETPQLPKQQQEQTQQLPVQTVQVVVQQPVKKPVAKKQTIPFEQPRESAHIREPQLLDDISHEDDVYDDVFFILGAGDINEISTVLRTAQPTVMVKVVARIINDINSPLGAEGKIKLIFSLARFFTNDKNTQDELFKLLVLSPQLTNYSVPFLYVASSSLYAGALGAFEDFKRRVTFASPSIMQVLIHADAAALKAAVINNNVNALRILLNVIAITAEQATQLLEVVVADGKSAGMVKPLVAKGADVNGVNAQGHTLLMVATKQRNSALVTALLQAKARIDYKNSQGIDALFIALDNGFVEIEDILREYGAKE
jgi:hypothetical protein